jgi:hypothetical protein
MVSGRWEKQAAFIHSSIRSGTTVLGMLTESEDAE